MRRITKISITIIILAAIYLALPLLFGIAAQRYTGQFLRNENKTLGKVLGIRLELTQYQRGWFRSTAILQIEKVDASGNFGVIKNIPIVIIHGPTYRDGHDLISGFAMIRVTEMPLDESLPYEIAVTENIGFHGERGTFLLFTNKKGAAISNILVHQLSLHMSSDLKADRFIFRLDGSGLGYDDPQKSMSAQIQNLETTLNADYLGDRHWNLVLGLCTLGDQLKAALSNKPSDAVTVNVNRIDLVGLQLDTKKMADVLKEVVELKQATDAQQPVKPTAWMAVFQQMLTRIIDKNTWGDIRGLSVTTPTGELVAHYDVSFPTLPEKHDYFDIATHNVSSLEIAVPDWKYTDPANTQFELNNFHYNEYNNTVFSRKSNMSFGAFNVSYQKQNTSTQTMFPTPEAAETTAPPAIYATGFTYQGELFGDVRNLSQTMEWTLAKFCYSGGCFDQVTGGLQLLKMNYNAFRSIADATRQVVQYDPRQSVSSLAARWDGLLNAYSKLISSESQVVLTHTMDTPDGKLALHGEMSWPNLNLTNVAAPTFATYLDQSVYELHLLFPAGYLDSFLTQQHLVANEITRMKATPVQAAKIEPPFELQAAEFLQYAIKQGYLKKVGKEYVMDLTGQGKVVTINGVAWKMPG